MNKQFPLNTRVLVVLLLAGALTGCQTQTPPRQQQASLGDWYKDQKSDATLVEAEATGTQTQVVAKTATTIKPTKNLDQQLEIYQSARNNINKGTGNPALMSQLDNQIISLQLKLADAAFADRPDKPEVYEPIIIELSKWLGQNTSHPLAEQYRYQLARIQDITGKTNEAEATLESLRSTRANLPTKKQREIDFRLGETAFGQNRFRKAIDHYTDVLQDLELSEGTFEFSRAMYMRGWSHLQDNNFQESIHDFIQLLIDPSLKTDNPQMQQDIYRGLILSINDAGGPESLPTLLDLQTFQPVSMDIYGRLIEFYSSEERWSEVISAYKTYQKQYPGTQDALEMSLTLQSFLTEKKQNASLREEKAQFIQDYAALAPAQAAEFSLELATYHRAEALQARPKKSNINQGALSSKAQDHFTKSIEYYQVYLSKFGNNANATQVLFDLAETYLEAEQITAAKNTFQDVVNSEAPLELRQRAAYFALTSLDAQIDQADSTDSLETEKLASAQQFIIDFPDHPKVPEITNWLMVHYFKIGEYSQAKAFAVQLQSSAKFGHGAYQVQADTAFAKEQWLEAAKAYEILLAHADSRQKEQSLKETWLDNSLKAYYQAARVAKPNEAFGLYQIIYNSNHPTLASAALFDAALLASTSKSDTNMSIELFRQYLKRYPEADNAQDARLKLANLYKDTENWSAAASLLTKAAETITAPDLLAIALLDVAELYDKAENSNAALAGYNRFLTAAQNPGSNVSYNDSALASARTIALIEAQGTPSNLWQRKAEFVTNDLQSTGATEKTRAIAEEYAISLARKEQQRYENIRITRDLQNSFKLKQQALQESLNRFNQLAQFDTPTAQTLANAGIGQLFAELSKSLLNAPIPAGLNELEEEEYLIIIEEQAFPFEEKALDAHQKNITELHKKGEWTEGVQTSLEALRQLLPARFNKNERFEGGITHAE